MTAVKGKLFLSNGRLDLWHPDESVIEGEKSLQREKRCVLAGSVDSVSDLWFTNTSHN